MSYSRKDEGIMRRTTAFLRGKGITVWVDNEKLVPGTPIWEAEIEKAIRAASAIVIFMSPDSKDSEWVRREITLADQYRKRIFPVLVSGDEDSAITLRLVTRQFVDVRGNEKVGLISLHQAVSQYLNELKKQFDEKAEAQNIARETGIKVTGTEVSPGRETGNNRTGEILLWTTIGWAIAGAIGGLTYSTFDDDFLAWISAGGLGGIIGGLVILTALRSTGLVSRQKNLSLGILGWALAGAVGWSVGFKMTEAIGAGFGMALFAMIGLVSILGMGYLLSNWKSTAVILLAWFAAEAIGWLIAREWLNGTLEIGDTNGWAIGTALGWGIAGFVTMWQLLKKS
jgi:hypothetical protein